MRFRLYGTPIPEDDDSRFLKYLINTGANISVLSVGIGEVWVEGQISEDKQKTINELSELYEITCRWEVEGNSERLQALKELITLTTSPFEMILRTGKFFVDDVEKPVFKQYTTIMKGILEKDEESMGLTSIDSYRTLMECTDDIFGTGLSLKQRLLEIKKIYEETHK